MNRKDIFDAFDTIGVDLEKKEQIKNKIEMSVSPNNNRDISCIYKYAIIAAFIVIFNIPCVVYAEEINNYITQFFDKVGFLTREERISDYIEKNVYEDSDGHIKMSVKEVLCDQKSFRAIILYEAIDDIGKEWIEEYKSGILKEKKPVSLIITGNVSGIIDVEEVEEFTTETTICMDFFCDWANEIDEITMNLFYDMTENSKSTIISVSENVEVKEYRLVGDNDVDIYYSAEYVRISKMSCIVYGKQNNLYKYEKNDYYTNGSFLVSDVKFPNVIIHCKNSSDYVLDGWSLIPATNEDGEIDTDSHHGCDTYIVSGTYYDENLKQLQYIEINNIESITINGNNFTLEEY